jgi:Nickel responsive protein SCO4226-like
MTKAIKSKNVYLVEHYSPGLTVDGLSSWAARVRDMALAIGSEGRAVRYLRSTIVPADEALLCVFEAGSEELVREVYARAGVPFERLSVAIADESEWQDPESPSGAGGIATSGIAVTPSESADQVTAMGNVTAQDKLSARDYRMVSAIKPSTATLLRRRQPKPKE